MTILDIEAETIHRETVCQSLFCSTGAPMIGKCRMHL
jgi:hypothetical protein